MKKLTKLKLSNVTEVLNDNEMKMISGGYGTGGYGETWFAWKCWCKYGSTKFMMSGTWQDVLLAAEVYCPTPDVMCDAYP